MSVPCLPWRMMAEVELGNFDVNTLNASFGYQTSRTGVFAEHGGQLGVHYHVFTSLAAATVDKKTRREQSPLYSTRC